MKSEFAKVLIEEKDFQALVDILPDFIAKYTIDGRIIYMNTRLRGVLGVEMNEIAGKLPSTCWPDGRFSEIQSKVISCGESGSPESVDLKVPEMPGQPMEYHHIRIVAETDQEDNIIAVIAFGRDLTDRVLLEQKLTASSRLANLGEMAAGIAHEVNNPLAILAGKIAVYKKNVVEGDLSCEMALSFVDELSKTLGRISNVTNGLIAFSRDGSCDPFKKETIQVIILDSLSYCVEKIKVKGIKFDTLNIENSEPIYVNCRATELSQVIVSLINNSYDAIGEDHDSWIRVELEDCGDKMELSIIDNGPGIPEDVKLKILHPFFTTKPIGHGTGLGLSISKSIVDNHNGTLTLDEQYPNTRFVISLPKCD